MKLSTRMSSVVGAVLALALVAPAPVTAGPPPNEPGVPATPQQDPSVTGGVATVRPPDRDVTAELALRGSPSVIMPAAGAAEVTARQGGAVDQVGTLPVFVGAVTDTSPAKLRVELAGGTEAVAAGVSGVVVRLRRTDGEDAAGPVWLAVDYSAFRHTSGGDWANRLRWVRLSDRAVLPTHNDTTAGRATAEVAVAGSDTAYALDAGAASSTGDYRATPLSSAASWQVSAQTGAFSWSYELTVPAVPGGLEPSFALSYSSNTVDGRTVSTNNQPSEIGEGWAMWPGYIERRYKSCHHDGHPGSGDLCWGTDNATLSLDGRASELVKDPVAGWRTKNDEASKVEQLFGAGGEQWKITTTNGVQYFFGSQAASASAWTVPVRMGAGENCPGTTFDTTWCTANWRLNLDRVVDPHGNTITYVYERETNKYARNNNLAKVTEYTRGGTLLRAEYGTNTGTAGPAPARVEFISAPRCIPNSPCATKADYPDTPIDQQCDGAACAGKISPTFWTTKRLAKVITKTWNGTQYRDVDSWTLRHSFPAPGGTGTASLWLESITHTGHVGSAVSVPAITFSGDPYANRVDSGSDGLSALTRFRMGRINNETGGQISILYHPKDCTPTSLPPADNNNRRCFPVRWTPEGGQPMVGYFHLYVVAEVAEVDRVAQGITERTSYDYTAGGASWRYNDDPLLPTEHRTWSKWRGFQKVRVRHGDPTAPDPADRIQSATESLYFKGMSGDRMAGPAPRPASVRDSEGVVLDDAEQLAGFLRETITYNGVNADGTNGPVVSAEIHDPWQRQTATQGAEKAFIVRTGKTRARTALSGGRLRRTEQSTTFTAEGLPESVNDLGDVGVGSDNQCTRTEYARNTGSWLLTLPKRVHTVAVDCSTTPSYPADAVSDVRTYYDGAALGAPPGAGNATKSERVASYTGSTPEYVVTSRAVRHDVYGRVLESYDALDRKSTTTYTPATGLPAKTEAANPKSQTTTTTLDGARGQPLSIVDPAGLRTDLAYDQLGRLTGVWRPGRSKERGERPNVGYRYVVRDTGTTYVTTDTLKANDNYVTSYELFDGFARPRQTQAPAWGGERILTDTNYDARGLVSKSSGPYLHTGNPTGDFQPVEDALIRTQTRTTYDGAERPTVSSFWSLAVRKWQTVTAYHGDRVDVTPPTGGTATSTYTDARGRTTELHQYHAATPTGTADVTKYGYTRAGALQTIRDPAGNTWAYEYDVRGRRIKTTDPDKGVSTATYDNADQMLTTTDARGRTVVNVYDALGRRTERSERRPGAADILLARWVYDTLQAGKPTSSSRFVGTAEYTSQVVGYDPVTGRPTGNRIVIPTSETGLAGTYQTGTTWKVDGSPETVTLPALGAGGGNPPEETVEYGYDDLGLPKTMLGAGLYVADTVRTRFGELGQLTQGSLGAEVWQTPYYEESTRRLQKVLTQKRGGGTVNNTQYAYDPAGNTTGITDTFAGVTTETQCARYDHLRRLTEAWTSTSNCTGAVGSSVGGPAPYWTTYSYDLTGNRTSERRHGLGGAADTLRTFTYPVPGQPRPHATNSVTTSGPGGTSTVTYDYDATGNTKVRPGQTLTWDAEGHVETVTASGAVTGYLYDADGNRLIAKAPAGKTLYLGGDELRVAAAGGARTGTRYYAHDGRTIAVRTPGAVHYLVSDHHGTEDIAINAGTLVASKRRFDPFGNPRGSQPTWPGSQGFVGGQQDPTGLTHLGAREYDPAIGRFSSVDPIMRVGDPQQLHGYAYADNRPTTSSDPDGLLACGGPDGIGCRHPVSQQGYTPQQLAGGKRSTYEQRRRNWVTNHRKSNTWRRFMGPVQRRRAPWQGQLMCNGLGKCMEHRRPVSPRPVCGISCIRLDDIQREWEADEADRQRWAEERRLAELAARKPRPLSFSVCGGLSQMVVAAEGCVAIDTRGLAFKGAAKLGFVPPSVEASAKVSKAWADDASIPQLSVDIPIRGPLGLGLEFDEVGPPGSVGVTLGTDLVDYKSGSLLARMSGWSASIDGEFSGGYVARW